MEKALHARKGNPLSSQGRTDNMFPDPHIKFSHIKFLHALNAKEKSDDKPILPNFCFTASN